MPDPARGEKRRRGLALAFALLAQYPKSPTPAAPVGKVGKVEAPSG